MFSAKRRVVKLASLVMAVSLTGPLFAQGSDATGEQARVQDGLVRDRDHQGRNQMFSRLDANGDGSINFAEFSALPTPGFDRQDANGDGNITREELTEQRFGRLDRDGNGLLSADELRPARDQARDQGRGGEVRERLRNMSPEQRQQLREQNQSRRHAPGNARGAASAEVTDSSAAAHSH